MKTFLEEYGISITVCFIVVIMLTVVSPISIATGNGAEGVMTALEEKLSGKKKPRLPREFREVEWIGNDSNAWIQTDEYVLSTDEIDTEFAFEDGDYDKYVICCIPWNKPSRFAMGVHLAKFTAGYGSTTTGNSSMKPLTRKDNDFHKWHYLNKVFEITDLDIYFNGEEAVYKDSSDITRGKVRIFWGWSSVTKGKIKSYTQKRSGQEIINLVPCYRKSDGEIGMYDLVSKTFYTNQGTGTFTKGEDV